VSALRGARPCRAIKDSMLRDEYAAGADGAADVAPSDRPSGRGGAAQRHPGPSGAARHGERPSRDSTAPRTQLRRVPIGDPTCGLSARPSSPRCSIPRCRAGVRLADGGQLHPSRYSASGGHRGGRRDGGGLAARSGSRRCASRRPSPRRQPVNELGVERSTSTMTTGWRAISLGSGPLQEVCRPPDRPSQVQAAAHVRGGPGRRISRIVR